MHGGFDQAEHVGITGQRGAWQHDDLTVHRIIVRASAGKLATLSPTAKSSTPSPTAVTTPAISWPRPEGRRAWDDARFWRHKVVVPTDADRFDTDLHFSWRRKSRRMLFAFEHLGTTKLVKTDRAGHRKPRQSNL